MSESVSALFDLSVSRFGEHPAIQYFCQQEQKWKFKSWLELATVVAKVANALMTLKSEADERIAILSMTRPEWIICDIAIMKASCIVVPIYHSSLNDQIAYILNDAKTRIIFVENEEQLKKLREVQTVVGKLERLIVFDRMVGPLNDNEIYFDDFLAHHSEVFVGGENLAQPIASLVYTSGTTGEPKGAMISHENFLYEALAIDKIGILTREDVQLLFLPLAHIFARVLAVAWIRTGHLLAFAQSAEKVVDNMAVIKPTFMAGVPRIFEKVRDKTVQTALSGGFIKRHIASLAFREADRLPNDYSPNDVKVMLLKKIVFDKIGQKLNERFGQRLRFLVSGGAPLAPEVFNFFAMAGIILCEGYGLTETCAATCLNLPWAMKKGSVGRPIPGTELMLSNDKEILVRGPGVFLGFWNMPEQSKLVLQDDGWLRTGDIGEIDHEGFVKIIDRKKDIIVTSQGKNIAPQRVENLIKSKSSSIAHVVVIGDKKPYLTALIALEPANAAKLVKDKMSIKQLSQHPRLQEEVKSAINAANSMLASFEQIKRFHILHKEFIIGQELTPTLKVKRKACVDEFKKEIKMLYT